MTEKQHDENWVKKKIKKWLDEQKAWHFPIPANGMGTSGVPDRIAVFDQGLMVAIEAKRPGRRNESNRGCSALQVRALELISMKKGFAWIVDSDEDLEALDRNIQAHYEGYPCHHTNLNLDYWKTK